jgi:hypothetical protein
LNLGKPTANLEWYDVQVVPLYEISVPIIILHLLPKAVMGLDLQNEQHLTIIVISLVKYKLHLVIWNFNIYAQNYLSLCGETTPVVLEDPAGGTTSSYKLRKEG